MREIEYRMLHLMLDKGASVFARWHLSASSFAEPVVAQRLEKRSSSSSQLKRQEGSRTLITELRNVSEKPS